MLPPNAATEPIPEDAYEGKASSAEVARLIESHVSYAHAIAAEVLRKVPPDLEKKDIQGWAELGLVEASNSFDRTRGVQFKTFAYYRIKGAIYDGLRKMGWYPKGMYQQMRFEMAANDYMKDVSCDGPRAGSPDSQLQDLKDHTANVAACYMLSLDAMAQEPEDSGKISAEEQVMRNQQHRNLRLSLAQLPETNRRVLEHCYFEGLTLEETGRKLGLSKSWVCRLHAKSLEMLRKQLALISGMRATPTLATFPGTIR
jgi:RNA polymerase sigma factor for flagellar operon FliA